MISFQRILTFLAMVIFLSSTACANTKQNLMYRNFWHPLYHGQRLNYCSIDGKSCGITLATQYCKGMGYTHATQAIKAPNLGLTHFFPVSARCKGWNCHGFMNINCAIPNSHPPAKAYHYREKRFAVPRFNHYRVDYCYETQKGCGKRAADAFCVKMGYAKSSRFERETHILATKNLSAGNLCFGQSCNGFKNIICYR